MFRVDDDIYPSKYYTCRLCGRDCGTRTGLGDHLSEVHKFTNIQCQSEVALAQNNLVADIINRGYQGYWIHDTFFVTGFPEGKTKEDLYREMFGGRNVQNT